MLKINNLLFILFLVGVTGCNGLNRITGSEEINNQAIEIVEIKGVSYSKGIVIGYTNQVKSSDVINVWVSCEGVNLPRRTDQNKGEANYVWFKGGVGIYNCEGKRFVISIEKRL